MRFLRFDGQALVSKKGANDDIQGNPQDRGITPTVRCSLLHVPALDAQRASLQRPCIPYPRVTRSPNPPASIPVGLRMPEATWRGYRRLPDPQASPSCRRVWQRLFPPFSQGCRKCSADCPRRRIWEPWLQPEWLLPQPDWGSPQEDPSQPSCSEELCPSAPCNES